MHLSIIGTNGFLSSTLAKFANERGWHLDMYGLDEPVGHLYDNFYKVNLLSNELDYDNLIQSDMIVYASGAGIQSNLHESAYLVYALNVTTPINICDQLKVKGYKGIFITFGSVFEMGQTKECRFFTENDIITSLAEAPNDYTISKRMLTRFIDGYKHDYIHWHFIIPTIYGEKENPARLIPYTINSIKNNNQLSFTAGDQVRQYIYIREVSQIIEKSYLSNLPSGIYNIEGKETMTVKEIVTLIHDILGVSLPKDCFGKAEKKDVGMKYLALDGKKLNSLINYSPSIKIANIINLY